MSEVLSQSAGIVASQSLKCLGVAMKDDVIKNNKRFQYVPKVEDA